MRIEVVIHVHDRLDYLARCLEKVHLCKEIETIDFLVSCNSRKMSVRDQVVEICAAFKTNYRFSECASAHDHFRSTTILCNAEHLILLHDDDYPGIEYFAEINALIRLKPESVAFGVDSNFDILGTVRRGRFENHRCFQLSPFILALSYFLNRCGPPFPLICYRRDFIVNAFQEEPKYGKYSDAWIVLSAAKLGFWISPALAFTYVMHDSNDSGIADTPAKKRLRQYLLLEMLKLLFNIRSYVAIVSNVKMLLGRFIKVDV